MIIMGVRLISALRMKLNKELVKILLLITTNIVSWLRNITYSLFEIMYVLLKY